MTNQWLWYIEAVAWPRRPKQKPIHKHSQSNKNTLGEGREEKWIKYRESACSTWLAIRHRVKRSVSFPVCVCVCLWLGEPSFGWHTKPKPASVGSPDLRQLNKWWHAGGAGRTLPKGKLLQAIMDVKMEEEHKTEEGKRERREKKNKKYYRRRRTKKGQQGKMKGKKGRRKREEEGKEGKEGNKGKEGKEGNKGKKKGKKGQKARWEIEEVKQGANKEEEEGRKGH